MKLLLWALGGAASTKLSSGDPLIGATIGALTYLFLAKCDCAEEQEDKSVLDVLVPGTVPVTATGCNVYYPGMAR
jgi:hypothetical protein